MRDVSSIDPMWEPGESDAPAPLLASVFAAVSRGLTLVAPHLVRFTAGRRPQLRVAWGARELHVRRDGLFVARRSGAGWEDNPRTNYVDGLRRRQERAGRRAEEPAPAGPPEPETPSDGTAAQAVPLAELGEAAPPASAAPAGGKSAAVDAGPRGLDLTPEGLRRAVDATMGRDGHGGAVLPPEQLKDELARLRAALTALDAVKDWAAVEAVDDELYKLHKAVEYTMRTHKASEAKSKLESLFK